MWTHFASLSDEDKQADNNTPFDDLILYHHSWGAGISNSFGPWEGSIVLLKSSCGARDCHPDDA